MTKIEKPQSKFKEGDIVEFKDYEDLKNYTGIVTAVISSESNPSDFYTYVLDNVWYGDRPDPRFLSGLQNSIQVVEKSVIGLVELLKPEFLEKHGWFILPDFLPEKFYVKNTYPVALKLNEDENYFEVFKIDSNIIEKEILSVVLSIKDYDKFINPILSQLRWKKSFKPPSSPPQ